MGVMICAALLLTAWAAFVFSRYNPDRGISSAAYVRPAQSERRIAGTDNHRRELHSSVQREES